MSACHLELKKDINLDEVNYLARKEFHKRKSHYKSFEQSIIYVLIHRFSNYEDEMWLFYKENRKFILSQIKKLLQEISNLDRNLAWDCQIVYNRYKNNIALKMIKSRYIVDDEERSFNLKKKFIF